MHIRIESYEWIIAGALLGVLGAFLYRFAGTAVAEIAEKVQQTFAPRRQTSADPLQEPFPRAGSFLSADDPGWIPFESGSDNFPDKSFPLRAVKIIFSCAACGDLRASPSCLVAVKRSGKRKNSKRKDGLLEFPGGKINPGETSVQALIRELREEEPGLILAAAFERALKEKDRALATQTIILKAGRAYGAFRATVREKIFYTSLTRNEIRELQRRYAGKYPVSPEVYSYQVISEEDFAIWQPDIARKWTPRSLKLIRALAGKNRSAT